MHQIIELSTVCTYIPAYLLEPDGVCVGACAGGVSGRKGPAGGGAYRLYLYHCGLAGAGRPDQRDNLRSAQASADGAI
jgi:hypothetical protein